MIWKFEFRRETMLWILAASLLVGAGFRFFELVQERRIRLPLQVVRDETAAAAIRNAVDSVWAVHREAARAPLQINRAAAAEFEALPGIGAVLAARIVDYRNAHGPFRTVDDLEEVPGIGPKRLEAIRSRCSADSG